MKSIFLYIKCFPFMLITLTGCGQKLNKPPPDPAALVQSQIDVLSPPVLKSDTNGYSSLVSTIAADSSKCPNGGYLVNSGLDLNRNGVLDPLEVTGTSI